MRYSTNFPTKRFVSQPLPGMGRKLKLSTKVFVTNVILLFRGVLESIRISPPCNLDAGMTTEISFHGSSLEAGSGEYLFNVKK